MNLNEIRYGGFDVVRAVRFLAGRVAVLEAALQAGSGPGSDLDAGGQGSNMEMPPTVLVVQEGLQGLLNDRLALALERGGYATVASIAEATDDELRAVNGVGPVTLREVREVIPGKA